MYVIGISKKHNNASKRRNYADWSKDHTHWRVYFYDKEGNFHNKRITILQAMYFKAQKKWKKRLCVSCQNSFISKSKGFYCPNCFEDN